MAGPDDDRLDDAAYRGFLLGQSLTMRAYGVGMESLADSPLRGLWAELREIAEGRLTIAGNPAEMLSGHPNVKEEFRQWVFETANEVIAQERQTAARVLRASLPPGAKDS